MSETKLPDIADELRSICFPFMIPGDTRTGPWFGSADLCHRAAAEITRLRAHAGWHEAIEAAAKVADEVADGLEKDKFHPQMLGALVVAKRIRTLLPPGGAGWHEAIEAAGKRLDEYAAGLVPDLAWVVELAAKEVRALLPPGGEKG